jgi:uroporphyrinogen III methyltransferase/synthase
LAYPTIATEENDDAHTWKEHDKVSTEKRWLVFTSENGVRYFMRQFQNREGDIRNLGGFRIAVVGHGTAVVLRAFHLSPDFIPTEATTGALAEQLAVSESWDNVTVVRVRGNLSFDNVEKSLSKAGCEIIPMTVYRTFFPKWPEGFKEKLFEYPPDVVTFTSGTSVEGLFENLSEDEVKRVTDGATLLSIGPSTSKVAEEHGLSISLEPKEHSIPAMIDELLEYANDHPLRRTQ